MQPQAPGPNLPSMQPAQPNYDFIVNPPATPKKPSFTFGGVSPLFKIVLIGIALILILVVFAVIKSATAKPNVSTYFVSVAQDQSLLIHIATAAKQQQGISTTTLNSAVTVNTAITSAQTSLLAYMSSIHAGVDAKTLTLKIKPAVDTTLDDAATAGNYNAVYKTTMVEALNLYSRDLKIAFAHTTGPRGKAELTSEFNSAQLLIKQLN